MYNRYGYVISFEKDLSTYAQARNRFPNAFSLDVCLKKNEDLINLAERYEENVGSFPVVMPNENMKAENGMRMLINHNLGFDLIDVDPFGAPDLFFPEVFELLDDRSVLFVTTGEMHRMRFDAQKAMARRGVKPNSSLKWARKFFRESCGEVVGAQIVEMALKNKVCLHPVFMYNYHVHPMGVHRLGFYARRSLDASEKARVRKFLAEDFTLGAKKIKYQQLARALNYPNTPFRFSDDCQQTEIKKALIQRLDYLRTM